MVFLILFIIANSGLIAIALYILIEGDTNRLSHGHDFRAEVCGSDDLADFPYMYYPDPYNLDIPLCVDECPTEVEEDSICYYDKNHTTLLKEWGCWDSVPSTTLGFYCVPGGDD